MKKSLLGTIIILLMLNLVASPPFESWREWKNKRATGKIVRDSAAGTLNFVPDETPGKYAISAYFSDRLKTSEARCYTLHFSSSPQTNSGVKILFYFRGKIAGKPMTALEEPRQQLTLQPGTSGTLSLYIKPADLPDLQILVPTIMVSDLSSGMVTVEKLTIGSEKPARMQEIENSQNVTIPEHMSKSLEQSGLQWDGSLLKIFPWPSEIKNFKFRNIIARSPLGVNILKLTPVNRKAGFLWPNGMIVLAEFQNGIWNLKNGFLHEELKKAGEIKSDNIEFAGYGTGAIAKGGDKIIDVPGGFSSDGIVAVWAVGSSMPEIKSIEILPEALFYCYLDEAQKELDRALRLRARHSEFLKKIPHAVGRWNDRGKMLGSMLENARKKCAGATDGYAEILMSQPLLRDRYNYFIAFAASNYPTPRGHLGDVFYRLWNTHMQGTTEVSGALEYAAKTDNLVGRALRINSYSFVTGHNYKNILSAGFTDSLTHVPLRAGFPDNLDKSGHLELARREAESIQLVLTAQDIDSHDCTVEIIPQENSNITVKSYLVDYVTTTASSNPQLPLTFGDTKIPDILKPLNDKQPFSVMRDCNQSIWLTFRTSPETEPKEYNFTVVVTLNGEKVLSLPIQLTVAEFDLGKNRLYSAAGMRHRSIARWYGEDKAPEATAKMIREQLEHNMEPIEYFYPTTPEDLKSGIPYGMAAASVCNAQPFTELAHPDPGMLEFIHLYASHDGNNYELIPATVTLKPRTADELSDRDLIITPQKKLSGYSHLKLHDSEVRDWYRRSHYSFVILYPSEGDSVELTLADGTRKYPEKPLFIQPDKKPEKTDDLEFKKLPQRFCFDSVFSKKNQYLSSIIVPKAASDEIKEIRLVNRCIEKARELIQKNYDALYAVGGDKVRYYMFGFDESGEHLYGQCISALLNARKMFPNIHPITSIARISSPELYAAHGIWKPGNGSFMPREDIYMMKDTQAEFWTYVGGGSYYPYANFERVDQPLLQSRAFFWSMVCFDHIKGWGHFANNYWPSNLHLMDRKPFNWDRWSVVHGENNGMEALYYPGPDGIPYPSCRVEAMRDGIDDVNYARLAAELIASKKFVSSKAKELAVKELEDIRNGFALSMSVYCQNPETLKALRKRLISLNNQLWKLED